MQADYKKFNLPELIQEIQDEIKYISKPGQQIIPKHEGESDVKLDPRFVKNILINLLSNAIKFSGENTDVNIQTLNNGKNVVIIISDSGVGISEEDKKHLFGRFFRGTNVANIPGTGLGLNIVSRYIEMMNGMIEVESELGKGTTFKITLPQ